MFGLVTLFPAIRQLLERVEVRLTPILYVHWVRCGLALATIHYPLCGNAHINACNRNAIMKLARVAVKCQAAFAELLVQQY